MSTPKNFLQIIVRCTLTLLFIAAFLIVLGIFNTALQWDIVGPKLEAILTAIFFSCIILSGCGVAVTLVVGIQEIAASFTALTADKRNVKEIRSGTALSWIAAITILTVLTIGALATANHRITAHRTSVFKRLAKETAEPLIPRLAQAVNANQTRDVVSHELYAVLRAIEGLSFTRNATIYLPDPDDSLMLKSHNPGSSYKPGQTVRTILAAKKYEKAILHALSGISDELDQLNREAKFTFYVPIEPLNHTPIAVLKMDGNSRENFREYRY